MGIDPGAANLGFGVVRVEGSHMVALDGGVVETHAGAADRAAAGADPRARWRELIAWHEPQAMALEEVYFGKNVRSAMAVGQASGVAMLAAAAARRRAVSPTRRRRSRWPSAAPAPPARTRCSAWSGPCSACPSRRRPTTPPTRSRWRSATAAAAATGRRSTLAGRGAARAGSGRRMIAAVRGEVMVRRPDHVVIDAAGVGYRLAVSSETLKAVPAAGSEAFLHAELIARDDSLALYGFSSEEERDLFRLLIIGQRRRPEGRDRDPLRRHRRASCCGRSPPATPKRFQAVPGIGKRTAERIIVELREKVAGALEEEVAAARRGGRRPRAWPATASSTSATRRSRPSSCSTASRAPSRGAGRRRPAQGGASQERRVSEPPDIGGGRIRTPGSTASRCRSTPR